MLGREQERKREKERKKGVYSEGEYEREVAEGRFDEDP